MTYTLLAKQILDGTYNSSNKQYSITSNISSCYPCAPEVIANDADIMYNNMLEAIIALCDVLHKDNFSKNIVVSFNKINDEANYPVVEGEIPYGDISLTLKYVGDIINPNLPTIIQMDISDVPLMPVLVNNVLTWRIADYVRAKFSQIWEGIKLRANLDEGDTSNIDSLTSGEAERDYPFTSATITLRGYAPRTNFNV